MNKEELINRVPHITILYWVIKIASTTLGETGADMFSMTMNLGYSSTIGAPQENCVNPQTDEK